MMLSRPISRLAALSLAAGLCWMMWALAVSPLLDGIAADRADIAQARTLLARYSRLEADLPAMQKRLDALRSGSGKGLLVNTAPALLTAEMQGTAQRLASSAGVSLRSSRTLPQTTERGLERVGVELDLSASTNGLAALLHAIAASEPTILVDRLAVQVAESSDTAIKAPDGQPAVGVTLRLISYARSTGAGAKL